MQSHEPTTSEPSAGWSIAATRRRALYWLAGVAGAVSAAVAGVPILGYLLSPARRTKDQWLDAGAVSEFAANETCLVHLPNPGATEWDGLTAHVAAYVRRTAADEFKVFAVNCTHLGCPVSWFPQSGLFLCPCHGGTYYQDGSRAAGPPPRGLYQYEHKIENGRLLVLGGHLPTLQDPMTPG